MTGRQLSEAAWTAYRGDPSDNTSADLIAAVTQYGITGPNAKKLANKLMTNKGACWLGAASLRYADHELRDALTSYCLTKPPSRWPRIGD